MTFGGFAADGPKHPTWLDFSHGSEREPGVWQVHADAGQAVGWGPGATAAGVAAHTEVHLGRRRFWAENHVFFLVKNQDLGVINNFCDGCEHKYDYS